MISLEENRKELARFSKNFLPILFELYVTTADEYKRGSDREPLIACIRAYVSITGALLPKTVWVCLVSQYVPSTAVTLEYWM